MIHIIKDKTGRGYKELLAIRKIDGCYEDTKNDTSKQIFTRTNILKDLLKEQNSLCAYCMSKISLNNASIEHIVGQKYKNSNHKKSGQYLDLDYNNMLAVCQGTICDDKLKHCDKSRSKFQSKDTQSLLYLSPLRNSEMQNIIFSRNGEIKYKLEDEDIKNDLNKVLNLNCKTLVENRKRVKDTVFNGLIKKKFDKIYVNKQLAYWIDNNENYKHVAIEELKKHI